MENKEQIEQYFKEIKEICDNISREDIDKTIELLFDAWKNDNQVFFCGNGGSAGTAGDGGLCAGRAHRRSAAGGTGAG